MGRIKFLRGSQKDFFEEIILKLNSPSLRGLLQFGFDVSYSSLKKYYLGLRLIPEKLFNDLIYVSKIDLGKYSFEVLSNNWGKVLGGKRGRRN